MKDYLVRAISDNHNCRAFACVTTNLTEEARGYHDMWPCASAALGRMMAATLMMGAMNKDASKMTVTINGGGPIGTLLCATNSDGKIKGFAANPEVHYVYNDSDKLAVGVAVGKDGTLKVTRDMGLKQPLTSEVRLLSGEIGDDFAAYFMESEQIPSVVDLGVRVAEDNHVLAAGGMIVQLLPEATEEDITYVEQAIKNFPPVSTLVEEGKSPEDILNLFFMGDVEILESQDVAWECDCSKEKFADALMTLPDEDLADMIENDHGCELTCQFCNKKYTFDEDELKTIQYRKSQA